MISLNGAEMQIHCPGIYGVEIFVTNQIKLTRMKKKKTVRECLKQ